MYDILESNLPELKPFPVSDEELLARYEKVFTAVVADVMDMVYKMDDRILPSNLVPLQDGYKVAGFAFTIKGVRTPVPEEESHFNARMAAFISSFTPNSFAVWDASGDYELAHYGEMMSYSSMTMGCKAAVVDGGVRDIDRIIGMGFKVWSKYRSPRSSLERHRIVAWQVPIRIGDVKIYPGDVVFGDMDGIVVVPRDIAYDVLVEAERRQAEELGWRDILATGINPVEALEKGVKF